MFAKLFDEVNGICPLCGKSLLRNSAKSLHKQCQAAHIYPHSPTNDEIDLLKDMPRLSGNAEDYKNIILLCLSCHNIYDNPKTKEGYLQLYNIKKVILFEQEFKKYYSINNIEKDIIIVLKTLAGISEIGHSKLSYTALKTKDKFEPNLPFILQNKINKDIIDFYNLIKDTLIEMEKNHYGISDLIANQVRTFYLQLKMNGYTQEQIYSQICKWLNIKTNNEYQFVTPIVVAYYIQNCEVFK